MGAPWQLVGGRSCVVEYVVGERDLGCLGQGGGGVGGIDLLRKSKYIRGKMADRGQTIKINRKFERI